MKKILLMVSIFSVAILSGCVTSNPSTDCGTGNICPLPVMTSQNTSLTGVARQAIQAIKTQDFTSLATLASTEGIRFSADENVKPTTDVVLSKQQIINALSLSRSFNRGNYDGSGAPIDLGIGQYRETFVYDVDFINAPEVIRNHVVQHGNTTNNIATVYTGKQIVEYYFTGFDAQYGGADWRSLYLILGQENNEWKVIGIVHGKRSI